MKGRYFSCPCHLSSLRFEGRRPRQRPAVDRVGRSMSSPVAVLIPTRDRETIFRQRAYASVKATSRARMFVYLDLDGPDYERFPDVEYVVGPRLGAAQSYQALYDHARRDHSIELFATLTDDAMLVEPGWDEWALDQHRKQDIVVLSPCCNSEGAHRVDMPLVSRAFADAVGFLVHPDMHHYGWPSVIDALADGICLVKAPADAFRIHHENVGSLVPCLEHDAVAFYRWYAWHKDHYRDALREKVLACASERK